jgi:hypothetical protein
MCSISRSAEVLMAAIQSLDLTSHQNSTTPASIGSIIQTTDVPPEDHAEYMDNFTHFCDTNVDTDGPLFDVCVSAIQRFQQTCNNFKRHMQAAVACCLMWFLFHFDIHNTFQSTPDDGDI